uniref:Ig-like domain-containing protein n=1 Tax=Varanus komodoensis TaxID=61221 RepID=A0A8D2J5X2_VARKO
GRHWRPWGDLRHLVIAVGGEQNILKSWQGSCVLISCEIKSSYVRTLQEFSLLWYLNPEFDKSLKDYSGTLLHKINTTSRYQSTTVIPWFSGRVKYAGSFSSRDCSLKVSQLQKNDSGSYGARLYGSPTQPSQKWLFTAEVIVEGKNFAQQFLFLLPPRKMWFFSWDKPPSLSEQQHHGL